MIRRYKTIRRNPAELLIVNPRSMKKAKSRVAAKKKTPAKRKPSTKAKAKTKTGVKRMAIVKRRKVARKAAPKRRRRVARSNPRGVSDRFTRMTAAQLREQLKAEGKKAGGSAAKMRARLRLARKARAGRVVELRKSNKGKKARKAIRSAAKTVRVAAPKQSSGRKPKKRGPKRAARRATTAGRKRKPGRPKGSKTKKTTAIARRTTKAPARRRRKGRGRRPVDARLTRSIRKSRKPGKKNRGMRGGMQSARRARRTALSIKKRPSMYSAATRKYAKAHGLMKVNPSIKDVGRAAITLLPEAGLTVGSAAAALWLGSKLNEQLNKPRADGTTLASKLGGAAKYAAPLTTGVVTAGLFTAARMVAKGKLARWSAPILIGGSLAAIIQTMSIVRVGADQQTIAQKLSLDKLLAVGEYTTVGGMFDRGNSIGEYTNVGEYEMSGTDDDVRWADDSVDVDGMDDESAFAPGEGGILSGRMFW